jgi:hypothetical protein
VGATLPHRARKVAVGQHGEISVSPTAKEKNKYFLIRPDLKRGKYGLRKSRQIRS